MRSQAMRLDLCVPAIQAGGLKLGGVTGLELSGLLADYLVAPPTTAGQSTRYPVALEEGISVSWPIRLPLFGEVEVGLGNEDGLLALRVPALPFVTGPLEARIAGRVVGKPRREGLEVVYRLRLRSGARVAVPLGFLGEVAVEVPHNQPTTFNKAK